MWLFALKIPLVSPDVNYKLEISQIGGIELLYPDNSVAILPDYCISKKELTVLYIYFLFSFPILYYT